MTQPTNCKGCRATVKLAAGEVERLLAEYLRTADAQIVDDRLYAWRLGICSACPDLQYGTTCRHCGCLVAVRAKLADKPCPAVPARWTIAPQDKI